MVWKGVLVKLEGCCSRNIFWLMKLIVDNDMENALLFNAINLRCNINHIDKTKNDLMWNEMQYICDLRNVWNITLLTSSLTKDLG